MVHKCGHQRYWQVISPPEVPEYESDGTASYLIDHWGEYVEVEVSSAGKICVAGALLGTAHPRIVRVGDFRVDIRPRGALVILRNNDVPGVIGRVGSLLGAVGINIAEYHQARLIEGGEALAAISIDGWLDDASLDELRSLPDVREARQVRLD